MSQDYFREAVFYDRNPKSMRTVPGGSAAGRDSASAGKLRAAAGRLANSGAPGEGSCGPVSE